MTDANRWLLPEGIEEVLPPMAERVESLRRDLLDLYRGWGYELVIPPFLEYLESLLTGVGSDLDLQTFKVTDQLTGRMMGVRADMTPQVARIDAHSLKRSGPVRLCYSGSVLHTKPSTLLSNRSPIQMGAEIYGYAGIEADIEVVSLMLETLTRSGVKQIHLDIGHVGVYRSLMAAAGLTVEQEDEFFELLQRKALPELNALAQGPLAGAPGIETLVSLASLQGGPDILAEVRTLLAGAPEAALEALEAVELLAGRVADAYPDVVLYSDLSELWGYRYYTGLTYTAYVPEHGLAVARGGRYDGIGEAFGRARPASGFSTDLKTLIDLVPQAAIERNIILAPADGANGLAAAVATLREQGEVVIRALTGDDEEAELLGCNRRLVLSNDQWIVE